MADSIEQDWISEEALAAALGVARDRLRERRPYLLAGEVEQKNGAVQWQKSAAVRVAGELGLAWGSAAEDAEDADAPPAADEGVETMTVVSQALNRNIVNAKRADGSLACVRVTDNRKFVPRLGNGTPMTLRAKKSTAGNWWLLVGREPRWPGMW